MLLFGNLDSHVFRCKKTSDPLVPLSEVHLKQNESQKAEEQWWTYVHENEEDIGFIRICNPHLGTVDYPILSVFPRTSL